MALLTRLTIEDFEKLPDAAVENRELVDGELVDVSGNTINHNFLRDCLVRLLGNHVEQHQVGRIVSEQEYDFDGNAHGPDVSFFSPEKARLISGNRKVQRFVPDLAIEIVSQNDKFEALLKKAQRYRACGTKEVWIFSIEMREAFVFNEQQRAILNEDQEFRSDLLPGFSIRLGDLFDRI
jgi:Uma2 family endonuclease